MSFIAGLFIGLFFLISSLDILRHNDHLEDIPTGDLFGMLVLSLVSFWIGGLVLFTTFKMLL